MKILITLCMAVAFLSGVYSCGKRDNPSAEASDSSYEFKFLNGPLEGKEYKASGLSREQVSSLFTEHPGEGVKGIFTQISNGSMTMAATIGLTANNQVQPFSGEDTGIGTRMVLSLTDNGANYIYGARSGAMTIKNLKIATIGGGNGSSLELTTYELNFQNAVFYDEGAAGNNETVEVRVTGKIIIK